MYIKISVIIPAYNTVKYIAEAIESILQQTFTNWELIIVNDGSSDTTQLVIDNYCQRDHRICSISQKNLGVVHARIMGLSQAKGQYIYFLDSDDRSLPNTLEHLYTALENNSSAIVAYGLPVIIDTSGNSTCVGSVIHYLKPMSIFDRIIEREFLTIGTALFRHNFINATDLKTSLKISEDWLMWCRIAAKGNFIFIGATPLVEYRRHADNTTNFSIEQSVQNALVAIDTIFSDNIIHQKFSNKTKTIHLKTALFYLYYDRIKKISLLDNPKLLLQMMVNIIKNLFYNYKVFLHIICRVYSSIKR